MSDIEAEEALLAYLRREATRKPGLGYSDRLLAREIGGSDVDAARASHRLHQRGLVVRYDTVMDDRPFGGRSPSVCTRLAAPEAT